MTVKDVFGAIEKNYKYLVSIEIDQSKNIIFNILFFHLNKKENFS